MSTGTGRVRRNPTDGPSDPPRVGEVLYVGRAASVQFRQPIHFRVIRVLDWPTYAGWVWLDGYQLNEGGEAVERRSIFVRVAGLRRVTGPDRRSRRRPPTPGGPAGPRQGGTVPD